MWKIKFEARAVFHLLFIYCYLFFMLVMVLEKLTFQTKNQDILRLPIFEQNGSRQVPWERQPRLNKSHRHLGQVIDSIKNLIVTFYENLSWIDLSIV